MRQDQPLPVAWSHIAVVLCLIVLLAACDDDRDPHCDLVKRRDFPSPDRKHTAVVFDMCCYNTTGYYPYVSVLRPGEKLANQGNVIGSGPDTAFLVTWHSPTNLTVECSWSFGDNAPMPADKTIDGVVVHFISRATRDASFLTNRCIPMTRTFLRTNDIAFDSDFDMSAVGHHSGYVDPDTRTHSLGITLGKRFDIDFVDDGRTNYIESFVDRAGMQQVFSAAGKATALAGTNLMRQNEALEFASTLFHRHGLIEENFHPATIKPLKTEAAYSIQRAELLPAYVVTWIRRDVKLPASDVSPGVSIIISATTSNLLSYGCRFR